MYILGGKNIQWRERYFQKPRSRLGCHTTSLMVGIGNVRNHWSSYLTSLSMRLLKLRKARRKRKSFHRWLPRTSVGTSIFPRSRTQRCCSWHGAAGFLTHICAVKNSHYCCCREVVRFKLSPNQSTKSNFLEEFHFELPRLSPLELKSQSSHHQFSSNHIAWGLTLPILMARRYSLRFAQSCVWITAWTWVKPRCVFFDHSRPIINHFQFWPTLPMKILCDIKT